MNYTITSSETSDERIIAYSRLLSFVFKNKAKFTPHYLKWQYAENPLGKIIGTDAFLDNELVAHHATIPVFYNFFGHRHRGLLAINNATHPEHQGKGLFTELGKATIKEARKLNYQFIITVTNDSSTRGYLRRFGFRQLSQLEVKIGIGNIKPSLLENEMVCSCWTDQSLEWRLNNPFARYFFHGNSIYANTHLGGVSAQIANWNKLSSYSIDLDYKRPIISLWIGLSERRLHKGFLFNLPNILKPSPLNLLFKDLQGNIPTFNKKDIKFELIDFDAY